MIEQLLAPYEEQLQQAESMPGWARRAAQDAVAETGVDMTRFATGGHLVSWGGHAPLDHQSGARKGRARTKKGNRYLAGTPARPPSRPAAPRPAKAPATGGSPAAAAKAKAQVAVGNTQLKVYHKMLSNPGMRYVDLGPDYYERRADTAPPDRPPRRQARRPRLRGHLGRIPDPDRRQARHKPPDPYRTRRP